MSEYNESTYGDSLAGRYDSWYPEVAEGMIDRIAETAGGGKVLELGIGTGRIALPLRDREDHLARGRVGNVRRH